LANHAASGGCFAPHVGHCAQGWYRRRSDNREPMTVICAAKGRWFFPLNMLD
jgi:hypothetical protein